MNNMPYNMQAIRLAGTTSLLKYQCTRAAQLVADHAVQLWGGEVLFLFFARVYPCREEPGRDCRGEPSDEQ